MYDHLMSIGILTFDKLIYTYKESAFGLDLVSLTITYYTKYGS